MSSEHPNNKDGYDVYLVEPINKRFQCPLCNKLMRDPIQTIRGELACEYCYTKNFGPECPIDKQPISPGNIFKDKFKAREIKELNTYCTYKNNGCVWIGTVCTVEDHRVMCQYQPSKCFLCNTMLINETMNDHLQQCVSIVNQENCLYSKYGCKEKPRTTKDYIKHLNENTFLHSYIQMQHSNQVESESEQMMIDMQSINDNLRHNKIKMDEEIKLLNAKVMSLTNSLNDLQETLKPLQFVLQNKMNTDDVSRNESNDASNKVLDQLSINLVEANKKISGLNLKQQLQESSTYNGKMIWKIDNLKFRMQKAISGEVTAIHSAPCFTEKYGFKYCARLYLNGDGMGKCTHLSLYIVIMKSEYDNLLDWPFNKRVAFRLINQDDSSKSIQESFMPDKFSSSFQKPKKDMNVAAGCPMFISKDELMSDGFVKDDAIFIQVETTERKQRSS